jgi:hypothetical protein
MESPIKGKTTVNIGKSMETITEILSVYALTCCDTMACCYMYGVGKGIALKMLRAGSHSLVLLRLDLDWMSHS